MQVSPIHIHKKHTNDQPVYQLIKNKIPKYAEIVVNLFDHCNMRCVFCPQDHDDRTGATFDEIMSKVDPIIDFVKNNPSKIFHLHVMGGELFQDEFIENGFLGHYSAFIAELERKKPQDKELIFNFITNLVFDRTSLVMDFLERHQLQVAISYDSVGRFNPNQLATFKRNVDLFVPYIRVVSLTMTKGSMAKIISGDPYFDYLYENFSCDFDYLLPGDEKLKVMMPSEQELFVFYKHLIDHYPKCINIEHFTSSDGQAETMPCTRGNNFTIFSNNSIPAGCSGSVILKNSVSKELSGTQIVERFIGERDCMTCEFYSRCTFSCFINNDYAGMVRDFDGCVYKELFKHVDAKR